MSLILDLDSISKDVTKSKRSNRSFKIIDDINNDDEQIQKFNAKSHNSSLQDKFNEIDSKLKDGKYPSFRSVHKVETKIKPNALHLVDPALSKSTRAQLWRDKFVLLSHQNEHVRVPDTNDPEQLEILYKSALNLVKRSSKSATWLLWMAVGYSVFQGVLWYFNIDLPSNFVSVQLNTMSHYKDILEDLGDPGGPSIGSSWSPMTKLIVIVVVHTITFIIIYKISGDGNAAAKAQNVIIGTGFMNPSTQNTADADSATESANGITSLISNIFGGNNKGESGIGGLLNMAKGLFSGDSKSTLENFNMDEVPDPDGNIYDD